MNCKCVGGRLAMFPPRAFNQIWHNKAYLSIKFTRTHAHARRRFALHARRRNLSRSYASSSENLPWWASTGLLGKYSREAFWKLERTWALSLSIFPISLSLSFSFSLPLCFSLSSLSLSLSLSVGIRQHRPSHTQGSKKLPSSETRFADVCDTSIAAMGPSGTLSTLPVNTEPRSFGMFWFCVLHFGIFHDMAGSQFLFFEIYAFACLFPRLLANVCSSKGLDWQRWGCWGRKSHLTLDYSSDRRDMDDSFTTMCLVKFAW